MTQSLDFALGVLITGSLPIILAAMLYVALRKHAE
jgi:hypothetical protein